MTKKICISGYYGFDNFGDETILKILIENLKNFESKPDITVFSSNPEKTASTHRVKSVHSFKLFSVVKSILDCDCLISGGGSLLQDATSLKSLIYYLGVIFTAQLFRKKVIIFAQGIGPIKHKFPIAGILKKASYICVRDKKSQSLLESWAINSELCADPVWNLSVRKYDKPTNKLGIQLRSYPDVTDDFINELAKCVNKYFCSKEIYIFSLQNKIDLEICNKLKQKINPNISVKVIENTSNEKAADDISQMDELIAMRYHACMVAIKSGVKLLPIIYDIKVEELAKEFSLESIDLKHPEQTQTIIEQFVKSEITYDEQQIEKLMFDFKHFESKI